MTEANSDQRTLHLVTALLIVAARRQSVQSQTVLAWYLEHPSLCNDEGLLDVSS